MRNMTITALGVVCITASCGMAAQIQGEYLEARTCDVYTGPCFANAEMGLGGKEAVMAWKVEAGAWNNVNVDGLGVAVVLNAENTLGDDGVFGMEPGRVESVILVDDKATARQREALVAFARDSSNGLAENVVKVRSVPFELNNNHISGCGVFSAGELARIETRQLRQDDCVCTNELVFYQPLTKVTDVSPVYTRAVSFQGSELNNTWENRDLRSAFQATFRR